MVNGEWWSVADAIHLALGIQPDIRSRAAPQSPPPGRFPSPGGITGGLAAGTPSPLPFTIHHSLFTIHYSLFTIHYSLFTIHYSLFPDIPVSDCCSNAGCETAKLRESQAATLKAVLVINGTMFAAELTAGLMAGSTALLADSLDMLGDTLVYGFSLYVVARSDGWKAVSAFVKSGIM